MALFSDQTLEEIRARTDIVELISSRVPLRRAGADFKACCPFHNEKTPSFIVSPSRRTFHCFGCGAAGDVFKFVMLSDGATFPDAVKLLAQRCGVSLQLEDDPQANRRKTLMKVHSELAAFYRRCLLTTKEAEHARAYLAKRKIDAETAEQFRIGYAPMRKDVLLKWAEKYAFKPEDLVEGGILGAPRADHPGESYYDKFRGRLMFPICDQNGQAVGFSGRILTDAKNAPKYYNSPETPIFRKSRILYGLCFAKKNIAKAARREALVCEGQIDVIRCHSCGFDTAVASQGTAFTEEHVALLKPYADSALLVFDGDSAGLKAATRTGRLFLAAGMPVRVALLPTGEDPDSILRDKGRDAFQAILDAPVSLAAFQIRAMRAHETSPESIDALARITNELFETFAACSKAVLQSYLIQESADLLGIPLPALEADFAAYKAGMEQRRHWAHAENPAPRPSSPAPDFQPDADVAAPTVEERPAEEDAAESPAPPPKRRWRFAETPLLAIADFLVKTSTTPSDDYAAAAQFVRDWLPETAMGDGAVKAVAQAALSDCLDGTDALGALAKDGSDEEKALIDYLARRKSAILASEIPAGEAVADLVAHVWIDFMKERRDQIDPSDEDGALRRLQLATAIRRLESDTSWQSRSEIISQLL